MENLVQKQKFKDFISIFVTDWDFMSGKCIVRLKIKKDIAAAMLVLLCLLTCFWSCDKAGDDDVVRANVLLYWPTDESDPAYEKWTKLIKKELRQQGIRGEVITHYSQTTQRYEKTERPLMNDLILDLRSQGRMPDIIISYGDANCWLLTTLTSKIAASIPVVCFGLNSDIFLPYQYDLLDNFHDGGRTDIVKIKKEFYLRENLELADSITPAITRKIRTYDFHSLCPHRFITMLDAKAFWSDTILYNELVDQMEKLETEFPERFFSNLVPKADEGTLNVLAQKHRKIIFSCRSVVNPKWNIDEKYNQIATPWAFYPQKSPNYFIQTKHDFKSWNMVDGPSFMPYFTMTAEDFLTNKICIGGYFPTAESQIRDAVSTARRVLDGENSEQIGVLSHKPEYSLNWDVLRPYGLNVNLVPDFVNVHNATLSDRNPRLYSVLVWSFWIIFISILIWSAFIITYFVRKARKNAVRLMDYATETISNNRTLEQMMEIADFRIWEQLTDKPDSNLVSRLTTTSYFREKLLDFLNITVPGNYSIQLHGAIDGGQAHWHELRMTVSTDEKGHTIRRGVNINIDSQKELQAMAAETNRIINMTRTREGFIAMMNHEMRTPLNSVVGYTQLLSMMDAPLDEAELHEYASAITLNSFYLFNTVSNIITATHISKSLIRPEIEKVNIPDMMKADQTGCFNINSADRIVVKEGPSDLEASADRKMLHSIINNLIMNALSFSEETEKVYVEWRSCNDGKHAAEILVEDRGKGIDPQYCDLIFERFFKIDSFTPGCGLGLYICKSFVEMMGGQISFDSEMGKGSVFKILLP